MKKIDRSSFLVRILEKLSNFLARYRGLPIIIGIVLIVVAGVIEFANLFSYMPALSAIEIIARTVGITIALIGILLLEPLGK